MGSHSVNSKIGRFQRKMNHCRDEFCRLKLKFPLTILVRSVEIAREFKFSIFIHFDPCHEWGLAPYSAGEHAGVPKIVISMLDRNMKFIYECTI